MSRKNLTLLDKHLVNVHTTLQENRYDKSLKTVQ